jgi:hypothetical protein
MTARALTWAPGPTVMQPYYTSNTSACFHAGVESDTLVLTYSSEAGGRTLLVHRQTHGGDVTTDSGIERLVTQAEWREEAVVREGMPREPF